MPILSIGGTWFADTDAGTAKDTETGETRPLTPDELSKFTGYFKSPEYVGGRAEAKRQAAADKDFGMFDNGREWMAPFMAFGGALAAGAGAAGGAAAGAGAGAGTVGLSGLGAAEAAALASSYGGFASTAELMAALGGGAGAAGATGGGMDWFEQLMQGYNPDLGFQGLNEAGSGLTGGMGAATKGLGLTDVAGYGKQLLSALGGSAGSNGLLGAALGALLGGQGANSKPAGTTTTVQDIPDWLKPYVVGNLSGGAMTQTGLLQNNGVMDAATAEYLKTITGDYLDPLKNPYLDATYKHSADLMGAGVDSRFSAAGRYGSGAHQGVLQEGMSNLATSIFGGNYQAERARQAAATGGAPTFQTGRAGAAYAPYSGFADLFPAGVRSTSTPYFSNTAGGIISGALAGSQLSKMFVGP